MFDINRICQLAGLEAPASGVLRESAPRARKPLNESAKRDDREVVYEIDDRELMAEAKRAEKNLVEHDFRVQVREEISQILKENQPKNSRMGQISRGGFGIGFK